MNSNSFKPPSTGIKPFNPVAQERSLYDLRRQISPQGTPGYIAPVRSIGGPIGGNVNPSAAFMRLKAMLAQGK